MSLTGVGLYLGAMSFELILGIYALSSIQDLPSRDSNDQLTAILVGQVVTLILAILGFAVSLYREKRNRKWDLEDREAARLRQLEQQKATATALATKTEETATAISDKIDERTVAIMQKVEENTDISRKAFVEANHINEKILNITRRFMESEPTETLERIDKTTEKTQTQVAEIHEAIDDNVRKDT